MKNHFTTNLKALRIASGKTQEQVSKALSLSRSAYGSYEEGRAHPKFDQLIKISRYFNITIDVLLKHKLTNVLPASNR